MGFGGNPLLFASSGLSVECHLSNMNFKPFESKACMISEFLTFLCDELMFLWRQIIEGHLNQMFEYFYIRYFGTSDVYKVLHDASLMNLYLDATYIVITF